MEKSTPLNNTQAVLSPEVARSMDKKKNATNARLLAIRFFAPLVLFFFIFIVIGGCTTQKPLPAQPESPREEGAEEPDIIPRNKVEVTFYLMSKCPFGTKVQTVIKKLLDDMGEYIDYKQEFIGLSREDTEKLDSLHGPEEVRGDIIELCAEKYFKKDHKFMDMIYCMASNPENIPDNWGECAEATNIKPSLISQCINSEEGENLLKESFEKSRKLNIYGSPTIIIAGTKYHGRRTYNGFKKAICCSINPEDRPQTCEDIIQCPERARFNMIVISDKRCDGCGDKINFITNVMKRNFPQMDIKIIDYSDSEGKAIYQKMNLKNLPAFLIDKDIRRDANFNLVEESLLKKGQFYILKGVGSNFDPTKEICDNGVDDNNDGNIDCDDKDCSEKIECRPEEPAKFEIFVMSHCPFGTKALAQAQSLLEVSKDKIKFKLHFIGSVIKKTNNEESQNIPSGYGCVEKDEAYYCSLHGPSEVLEEIRSLCVMQYYPQKHRYMNYIMCRIKAGFKNEWEKCLKKNKMNIKKIKKCSEGPEGLRLFEQEAELTKALNISASPTFLINSKYIVEISNRSPAGYLKAICDKNPQLSLCSEKILKKLKMNNEQQEINKCAP